MLITAVTMLLPNQFIATVAELFLRLHVQQDDVPTRIHHHHGVGSRFQQSPVPALHPRQMGFRVFAHADVADRRRIKIPSALSSGLSMSSMGNSPPSLRRPMSSIPVPIGRCRPKAVLMQEC
jgi:hypothetical protein